MSAFLVIAGEECETVARRAIEAETVRAPDGVFLRSGDGVTIAHASLLLAPGERSKQVMERGAITVVVDGRIDGDFTSDAAAVLDAYERSGPDAAAALDGEFSFAIWNGATRELFCARDAIGIKPLYFAQLGSRLIVASGIDMIRAHPGVGDELDEGSVAAFLLGPTAMFRERTFYASIKRLPPGHSLLWREGSIEVKRQWTLPLDGEIRYRRHDEYVDHFREIFDRAVGDRLRGTSAAVMMSGGLDSTSVAATARHLRPEIRIDVATTSYASMFADDEATYASMVAKECRLEHHVYPRAEERFFADRASTQRAEPFEDPLAEVFVKMVSDASKRSRVILAGQGGDIVFYTSHTYFRSLIKEGRLVRAAADVFDYWRRAGRIPPLNLRSWVKGWFTAEARHRPFPPWIRAETARRHGLYEIWEQASQQVLHPMRPEAHRFLVDPSWPRVFETWDPGETHLPIELTYPMLDRRVVEFLFALPPMPWFGDKYLLREAMRGRLPEPVRTRRKSFLGGDPLHLAMQRERSHVRELLQVPALGEYLDVDVLLREIDNDSGANGGRLVLPIALASWWRARPGTSLAGNG
jgi:asparagine synthase (glutamine-hydrolysing)